MISVALSFQLRDAGLRWEPRPGDRFVVNQVSLLDTPFVLSDMTVEVYDFPTGRVIGFNGTTEWALDSVEMHQALWLPGEPQLRDLLGGTFQRLERRTDPDVGYRVVFSVRDEERYVEDADPAEAYGEALLVLLREGVAPRAARRPTPYVRGDGSMSPRSGPADRASGSADRPGNDSPNGRSA